MDKKFGKILNTSKESKKMYSYSSCAKDFIPCCVCAGECFLKNEKENYVKALVIGNKSDLDGDI